MTACTPPLQSSRAPPGLTTVDSCRSIDQYEEARLHELRSLSISDRNTLFPSSESPSGISGNLPVSPCIVHNIYAPQPPLLNALPFFLVLAVWAVAFFIMRKKLGRENLEQEIAELRAFETEDMNMRKRDT